MHRDKTKNSGQGLVKKQCNKQEANEQNEQIIIINEIQNIV